MINRRPNIWFWCALVLVLTAEVAWANSYVSGLSAAGSVGATDTFADCVANGCNSGNISKSVTAPQIVAGGVSVFGETDPVNSYSCSGAVPITIGSISSSSNSLTVASAANWATGMGILVQGAGTSGGNLSTTISSISGTTFTLAANASTTVTNNSVFQTSDTTGSITTGTNSLTVASATKSTWAVGMGIDVAGAGAAGADLITTISNISGTTFTLANNAGTTVSNALVNHDDTSCLNNAAAAGLIIRLRASGYNVTNEVSFNVSGAMVGEPSSGSYPGPFSPFHSVIMNRALTTDTILIASSGVTLRDFAVIQNLAFTPTNGWGIDIANATTYISYIRVEDVGVFNTNNLLLVGSHVEDVTVRDNFFVNSQYTPANACVAINNPSPGGDLKFTGNTVLCYTGLALEIARSDVNEIIGNKFNNCASNCVWINSFVAGYNNLHQLFVGNSFESSTSTGPLVLVQNGNSATVDTMMFVGNHFGLDNGHGGISIGSGVTNTLVSSNMFNGTGTPIVNSGTTSYIGPNTVGSGTPAPIETAQNGVAAVTCTSGISATTGTAFLGKLTHC